MNRFSGLRWIPDVGRFSTSAALAALLVLAGAGQARGQVGIFGAGGLMLPTGPFDDVAEAGISFLGGAELDVGDDGFFVGAEGGYASSNHHVGEDQTSVFHAFGYVGHTFFDEGEPGFYVLGGGGWLGNQLEGADGTEINDNQFGLMGAVGFSFPLSDALSGFVETRVVDSDVDGMDFNTNHGGVLVGLVLDLGGG